MHVIQKTQELGQMTLYYLLMEQPFHWPSRLALCLPARNFIRVSDIWGYHHHPTYWHDLPRAFSQQRYALHLII